MNCIQKSLLYLSIFSILFPKSFLLSQTAVFSDNFDTYSAGQQLACQNPTEWTTWSGTPCSATEDAYISNLFSNSTSNSLVIVQNNDVVKDFGILANGVCEINFQVYIPNTKSGYFNTLSNFSLPSTYQWAMQVFFDSPGTGRLDAAGASSATFSYPHDTWFSVKILADLVSDHGELWIAGTLIHSWQWTKGTFGSSLIPLQVDANDFFGATANDQMYIDDYSIIFTSKITSTAAGGNWSNPATWVGGIVPSANTPVEVVAGASVNLDSDRIRDNITFIKGELICNSFVISGEGNFSFNANSTLSVGSPNGISLNGTTGNIQVTGLRSFSTTGNYIYNATSSQITGSGLPSTINSLTINNSAGVTISNSIAVSSTITMASGNILLNGNTLTLGTGKTNTLRGTLNYSSGFITGTGTFKRWFSNSNINIGNSQGLFPMGTSIKNRNLWAGGKPNSGGTISVQYNHLEGLSPISFTENAQNFISRTNTNWSVSTADGFNGTNLSIRIQGSGIQSNQISDLNISRVTGAAGGNYSAPTGNIADPQVNRIGLNAASLANTFYFASVDAPLPVELFSFSAVLFSNSVLLNWETASEVNNYGFEIERKSNVKGQTSDGWEKIGFVNGNGNSNSPKYYSFEDKNLLSGNCSYRLKQIDNDGAFEYSKIIEVDVTAPIEFSLSRNYPNPFNPTTTIKYSIPAKEFVTLKVYNILGKEAAQLVNSEQAEGFYSVTFDGSGLSSGVYFYKLQAGSFTAAHKMILEK